MPAVRAFFGFLSQFVSESPKPPPLPASMLEKSGDTEISALANYVIAHFGGKQGNVTPDDVAKRRSL